MDHISITVQDGAMVSTKRGFQVSKTKHQGILFVNTYIAPEGNVGTKKSSSKGASAYESQKGLQHCFRLSRPSETPKARTESSSSQRQQKKNTTRRSSTPKAGKSDQSSSSDDASCENSPTTAIISPDVRSHGRTPSPDTFRANVWDTHEFGFPMTARGKKMVHVYFSSIPSKMYPLDNLLTHNPARTPSFLERINSDLVIMRCVTGTGMLIDNIRRGQRCSDEILEYMAQFYGLVNLKLQEGGKSISKATIECVCSMAIGATHIGQYDHWRLHMKGLRQITDLETEALSDGGYLMNKLRRADIKGAATVGELPFLQHTRLHDNVSDALPLAARREIAQSVEAMLEPCGIQPLVVQSVSGLAVFASVLRAASASGSEIRLDPHGFIDEWYWVIYQLLRHPGPLCDPETPAPSLQVHTSEDASEDTPKDDLQKTLVKAPTIKTLFMPPPLNVKPAHSHNILETLVRLASVLYIEALIPDDPRTLNGYAVLLALMSKTMDDVMGRLRCRAELPLKGSYYDGLFDIATMKPVMIWAALVAYIVASLGDREVCSGGVRYERSIYRDCLLYFIGPEPDDVRLLSHTDLAFCEVLGIQGLLRRKLDTKELLKAIIRDDATGLG
ncbi:hypothetical protein F5X68DRAFT_200115 [Plectosphaerella plurivora]|uniref:Uncharacterized protein n=1 Tax=Plectosphaerella plurivora TaxID=936078 RepID=A0A9P8VJ25_9PEZI|nr:hypothetical protein F5X68DRAFT_200115 [Plectosphaerella plurivora]